MALANYICNPENVFYPHFLYKAEQKLCQGNITGLLARKVIRVFTDSITVTGFVVSHREDKYDEFFFALLQNLGSWCH